MNYKSLFENDKYIDTIFNDPNKLKKQAEEIKANSSKEDQQALDHYIKSYVEPALDYLHHKDASSKDTPEYKIYETLIRNKGNIEHTKKDLEHSIHIGRYSKELKMASRAYNKLVSDMNVIKKSEYSE
jgi:hypothetical protein